MQSVLKWNLLCYKVDALDFRWNDAFHKRSQPGIPVILRKLEVIHNAPEDGSYLNLKILYPSVEADFVKKKSTKTIPLLHN